MIFIGTCEECKSAKTCCNKTFLLCGCSLLYVICLYPYYKSTSYLKYDVLLLIRTSQSLLIHPMLFVRVTFSFTTGKGVAVIIGEFPGKLPQAQSITGNFQDNKIFFKVLILSNFPCSFVLSLIFISELLVQLAVESSCVKQKCLLRYLHSIPNWPCQCHPAL